MQDEFLKGINGIVLRSRGLRLHSIEAYSEEELSRLHGLYRESIVKNELRLNALMAGNTRLALDAMEKKYASMQKGAALRDKAMAESLKGCIRVLLREFPGLAREKEVRVLVQLGRAHTPVSHALMSNILAVGGVKKELASKGITVKRVFDEHFNAFPYSEEIWRVRKPPA